MPPSQCPPIYRLPSSETYYMSHTLSQENYHILSWATKYLLLLTHYSGLFSYLANLFSALLQINMITLSHYHAFYIVFIYFALFKGYEDDIFEFISNFLVQRLKFGGKINKFIILIKRNSDVNTGDLKIFHKQKSK